MEAATVPPEAATEPEDVTANGAGPEHVTEDPPEQEDELRDDALVIAGGTQLSFNIGGKRPTTGSLRLVGGKIELESAQFSKGERVAVVVEAVVNEISFKDETDPKTGQVIGCERRHRARITGVRVLEDESA